MIAAKRRFQGTCWTLEIRFDTWRAPQLRAHFEDSLKWGKPLVLAEFGRQHYSGMAARKDFTAMVYEEVESWNAKHANVAGARQLDSVEF